MRGLGVRLGTERPGREWPEECRGVDGLRNAGRAHTNFSLSHTQNAENIPGKPGNISAGWHMQNFLIKMPAKRSQMPKLLLFFFCLLGRFRKINPHMPIPGQISDGSLLK